MTRIFALFQLHTLYDDILVELVTTLQHGLLNRYLKCIVVDFWLLNFREQVHEQIVEQAYIFIDQFGKVHVTDGLQDDFHLILVRLLSLDITASDNA